MDTTILHFVDSPDEVSVAFETFLWDTPEEFLPSLGSKFTARISAFERSGIQLDLEILEDFGLKQLAQEDNRYQLALL